MATILAVVRQGYHFDLVTRTKLADGSVRTAKKTFNEGEQVEIPEEETVDGRVVKNIAQAANGDWVLRHHALEAIDNLNPDPAKADGKTK